jgi:hypothetical protein
MDLRRGAPFSPDDVYNSLKLQAESGSWLNGFRLRDRDSDPWNLGIFDPTVVAFSKPEARSDDISRLRSLLLDVLIAMFISPEAWDKLGQQLHALYTDEALCSFMQRRSGNLFLITPHVQFHDLGIVALKSLEVRSKLPSSNPFACEDDPGARQSIVANRVLTMLDHEMFQLVTGVPIVEGLMLPMCDVVTTISGNGSGRQARTALGRDMVTQMNDLTRAHLIERTTKGNQIIILAPSGAQASLEPVDRYSKALVVGAASPGTEAIIVEHNRGESITHRNAVAGVFLDCPSISDEGEISVIDAGIALCPQVFVPEAPDHIEAIMRATIRCGVGQGRKQGHEFRYGTASGSTDLHRRQIQTLEQITLTEIDLS